MKALGIAAAVLAVGALLFWVVSGGETSKDTAQAPVIEEPPVVEEEPVALALPPELDDLEDPELVSEEEPEEFVLPKNIGDVTKPRVLGRKMLPDGRVEVRILQPVLYGNGEKRVLVRVLRARPKLMKRNTVTRLPEAEAAKGRK